MKKNTCSRVKCNLLQAEVYVRFPVRVCGDGTKCRRYVELQEIPTQNGVVEHYVELDYPITAESVNSYADSADYRKNPEVIRQAVPRQNLGDISEVQKLLREDMSALRDIAIRSQEIMDKLQQVSAEPTAEPIVEPTAEPTAEPKKQ